MNTSIAFAIACILGLIVLSIAGFSIRMARSWRYGLLFGANLLVIAAILLDPSWTLAAGYRDLIGIAFIDALIIRNINKKTE